VNGLLIKRTMEHRSIRYKCLLWVIHGLWIFFHEDLYKFCEEHPEYEHTHYSGTLEKNGLKWCTESMEAADVSKFDAKSVIALLMGAVRAERFCDGALLGFFNSGCILRWLERLKSIHEGGVSNGEQETK